MWRRVRDYLDRLTVIRGEGYKSALRQYGEMIWLFLRHHLSPTEYYVYELGRRGVHPRKLQDYLITSWAVRELRPRLNSRLWEPVLRNKILFHQHMARHHLPVAALYGLFHPMFGYCVTGAPLKDEIDFQKLLLPLTGRAIIIKPVDGLKGSQIARFHIDSGGTLINPQGIECPCREVVKQIGKGNGFLIEDCLINHPDIRVFNPSSLNTCRVVTFINRGGSCRILFATARFGRRGSVTDNWSAGGVAVGIDVDTGTLGRGLLLPQFGGGWTEVHPDSGQPFAGTVLPHWQEVLALVKQAAESLPWCHAIGWDVAITPDGPVLVEGNGQWNPSLGQAFTGGLLTPELRKDLAELGLRFPA